MCEFNFLRYFDFFGYIPQFRIKGNERFKSEFGGLIFLIFILITIAYITFQSYTFFHNIDNVVSTWVNFERNDGGYRISNKDFYFGIKLSDLNGTDYTIDNFPYFDFIFSYDFESSGKIISENLTLGQCKGSHFYFPSDKDFNNKSEMIDIIEKFRCPNKINKKLEALSYKSINFLSLKAVVKEKYRKIKEIKDLIKKMQLKMTFIYSLIHPNSKNKFAPYFSDIKSENIYIDPNLSKKVSFALSALETKDCSGLLNSDKFEFYKNVNFSKQKNGTVFQMTRYGDEINTIEDFLQNPLILRINIGLSSIKFQYFRTYRNIFYLISVLGSFIPNLYVIFVILGTTVNRVKGKNTLMGNIFSAEIINRFKEFHDNKQIRKSYKYNFPSFQTYSNDLNLEMDNEKEVHKSVGRSDECNNTELVKKNKGIFCIETLFEVNKPLKFNLMEYIKSNFCSDPKSKFMNNAYNNFHGAIEIDSYLSLNQEFELFKDFYLDKNQKIVFELASKYKNFRNLFENEVKNVEVEISIHQSIAKLYERKNKKDFKIITFLENNLKI